MTSNGYKDIGFLREDRPPGSYSRSVSGKQLTLSAAPSWKPRPRLSPATDVWLPADGERWRAYLDNDGVLSFFCAECAEREFGELRPD